MHEVRRRDVLDDVRLRASPKRRRRARRRTVILASVVKEPITPGSEATFAILYRNESDRALAIDMETEAELFALTVLDAKGERADEPSTRGASARSCLRRLAHS